jgi:predicted helicase
MLPRIPLVEDAWPFIDAGRKLSDLHLGYESVTPYPLEGLDVQIAPATTRHTTLPRREDGVREEARPRDQKARRRQARPVVYNDADHR